MKAALLVDTHAHASGGRRGFRKALERAFAAGLGAIVVVGIDLASSAAAVDLAEGEPRVKAAVGVHPHYADRWDAGLEAAIRRLAARPEVVAVGECGLDHYRDLSPRSAQAEVLRRHIALAREVGKPLIVHDREAHREVLAILRQEEAGEAVMHCFSGDWAHARLCLDLGFHIGIAGPVTYRGSQALQEVVRSAPPDRLLLETDCPYLTPEPRRGQPNEPAHVNLVAGRVAELRRTSPEEVARVTTANASRLFRMEVTTCPPA